MNTQELEIRLRNIETAILGLGAVLMGSGVLLEDKVDGYGAMNGLLDSFIEATSQFNHDISEPKKFESIGSDIDAPGGSTFKLVDKEIN